MAETELFQNLATLPQVAEYVETAYRVLGASGSTPGRTDRLPFAVAEAGVLMERAVVVAGSDGITRTQLRSIFQPLGQERFDRALDLMRSSGVVVERRESRANKTGRMQTQVVFYAGA